MRAGFAGLLASAVIAVSACSAPAGSWEYPVRLGDSRERVYDLLGLPSEKIPDPLTASIIEWFPVSGVSVEFDEFHKARVLHFPGEYHLEGWIVSDRNVLFGLHPRSEQQLFTDRFVAPDLTAAGPDSRTHTWRHANYAILAEFWAADVEQAGRKLKAGSLRRLEVSPAQ